MHVTFLVSQLPILIALVVFVLALFYKRESIRTGNLVALVVCTVILFLVLTGALNALHLPRIVLHLF